MTEKIWTNDEFFKIPFKQRTGKFIREGGRYIGWYKDGEPHRLDGPACEWVNGTKSWCKEGKKHRLDGPAIERTDFDAAQYHNGKNKEYWIEDEQYTEEEFKIKAFAILNGLEKFL
jgi:hypothetical protein